MRYIVANTTLNLYHGGLQEVEKTEHLKVSLMEDEIVYCRSVGDVSPSMNIPGQSMSVRGPSPSIIDPSSSVSSPSTSVLDPSTSWDNIGPPRT